MSPRNGNSATSVSDEAARRVAVHDEREIGETVLHRVERLRRRDHGLGQQVALHAALRGAFHVLAERHGDVGHQQMRRRHPRVDVEDSLRIRGRSGQPQSAGEHSRGKRRRSHAFLPFVMCDVAIRAAFPAPRYRIEATSGTGVPCITPAKPPPPNGLQRPLVRGQPPRDFAPARAFLPFAEAVLAAIAGARLYGCDGTTSWKNASK